MNFLAPLVLPCVVSTSVDNIQDLDLSDSVVAEFSFFSISYIRPLGDKYCLFSSDGKDFVVALSYEELSERLIHILHCSLELFASALQSQPAQRSSFDYAVIDFEKSYCATSTM
jgi:hypothetical protein